MNYTKQSKVFLTSLRAYTRVRVGFAEYYKKGCLAGNNYSVIKKSFTTDKQG